jgi:hypothetical protein
MLAVSGIVAWMKKSGEGTAESGGIRRPMNRKPPNANAA